MASLGVLPALQYVSLSIFLRGSTTLPDPVPEDDGNPYNSFIDVYGKPTTEEFFPSLKAKANHSHGIPFHPVKQHALNTNQVLICGECTKTRCVYSQKKCLVKEISDFKCVTSDLLHICGATLREFKQDGVNSERQYIIEKVFVMGDLTCETRVLCSWASRYVCALWQKACTGIMYEHIPFM